MNKGTKIALGVMGILLLACLAGVIGMLNDASDILAREKEKSVAEADTLLVLAASNWNYSDVEVRTSEEFPPPDEARKMFTQWNETYGKLVSGKMEQSGFSVEDDNFKNTTLVAQFESVAEFDKGKARVTMTLTRAPRNAWELAKLELSPVP